MSLSSYSLTNLLGSRPKLEFEQPMTSDEGKWLLSGKMIVEFRMDSERPVDIKIQNKNNILRIEMRFFNAESEQDAVRQSAEILRLMGVEIGEIASLLLNNLPRPG